MRKYTTTALMVLAGGLGGAVQPAALPAAEEETCGQALWDAYNDCLMSTSNGFIRAVCDLEFVLTWYSCHKPKA